MPGYVLLPLLRPTVLSVANLLYGILPSSQIATGMLADHTINANLAKNSIVSPILAAMTPEIQLVSVVHLARHRFLVQIKRLSEEYITFAEGANVIIIGFVWTTRISKSPCPKRSWTLSLD